MNEYVLIISIGPVQGFIAAARRSRDLWSGSWLLSEMAKACAKSLYKQKAELIFPAPADPVKELAKDSELSVGNKIQVIVTANSSDDVAKIAQQAKQTAKDRFVEIATAAKNGLTPKDLRDDIWQKQIHDYVESQAAWAKINANQTDGYAKASELAAKVLAARKATRDFGPAALKADDRCFMLPKSSLDGARETVLQESSAITRTSRRKLGLSESEQLDCAGIAKRLGGNIEQFTPFSRIAAHSWLKTLPKEELLTLCKAYEPLIALDLATRVSGNDACYKDMPFDAQYCYRSRLESARLDKNNDAKCSEALQELFDFLKPIWQKHGQPCPYSVLLLADGDRMGELLDKAKDKDTHQTITQALSAFAGSVRGIVRQHEGHAIYAGGDDVLAFVPLNSAYACAKALSEKFSTSLNQVATTLGVEKKPTLSVGLAISHMMEPLGNIRALADKAEKIAKGNNLSAEQQRNALAITLDVRSGSTTSIRLRWDDDNSHKAFQDWIAAYSQKTIPSRVAYDTRNVYQRTLFALQGIDKQEGIPKAEFKRMLDKTRTRGGEKLTDDTRKLIESRANSLGYGKLDSLATELIIARWFAAKKASDLGREQ